MKKLLIVLGFALLCASIVSAAPLPGEGFNGSFHIRQGTVSTCTGNFGGGTGVCNIFEEPDNPEVQDFNLGSPNIGTGLVDILDPNGQLSDTLLFYLNSDGNVHALFTSDVTGTITGATTSEDVNGNWCWLCGLNNNLYTGVSPSDVVPEPASLLLLGSGLLGLASQARKRLRK